MTAQTYQQLIVEGLRGLPKETLAEITDFVYFVRRRALHPEALEGERAGVLVETESKQLSREEEAHLELEFEGYERLYPRD